MNRSLITRLRRIRADLASRAGQTARHTAMDRAEKDRAIRKYRRDVNTLTVAIDSLKFAA